MLVCIIGAVIWGIGAVLKAPIAARMTGLVALWSAVVLAHLLLPANSALRLSTGGSAAPWLLFGGFVGLALLYARGLKWLRARRDETAPIPAQTGAFTDTELGRYTRHIIRGEVGGAGQKRLKSARVLVIGAGGLGSPALLYLAAAGVGTIGVIDDDVVDATNLQRQIIHTDAMIDLPKVQSAATAMTALNPFVNVKSYNRRLTPDIAADLFDDFDIILDGTDNFDTRYLANATAHAQSKPLISGALTQWEGQISVFDPADGAPCYQCIFPNAPAPGLAPSCAQAGVIGPLPGVIGSMMAVEAVKLITGAGTAMRGEMLIYDALYGETRKIRLKPRGDCPTCGTGNSHATSLA